VDEHFDNLAVGALLGARGVELRQPAFPPLFCRVTSRAFIIRSVSADEKPISLDQER
jgi:hypothetical protein